MTPELSQSAKEEKTSTTLSLRDGSVAQTMFLSRFTAQTQQFYQLSRNKKKNYEFVNEIKLRCRNNFFFDLHAVHEIKIYQRRKRC